MGQPAAIFSKINVSRWRAIVMAKNFRLSDKAWQALC